MPSLIKIVNGTGRSTGEPLCGSCKYSLRRDDRVWCQYNIFDAAGLELTKPVYSCSAYYNANLPSITSMEKIAWELKTDSNRRIGFRPPKKDDHRHNYNDED